MWSFVYYDFMWLKFPNVWRTIFSRYLRHFSRIQNNLVRLNVLINNMICKTSHQTWLNALFSRDIRLHLRPFNLQCMNEKSTNWSSNSSLILKMKSNWSKTLWRKYHKQIEIIFMWRRLFNWTIMWSDS